MLPHGPSLRNPGIHTDAGTGRPVSGEIVWPIAAPKRSTSSGSVGVPGAERVEHQRSECLVPDLAGQHLDDAAGDVYAVLL